MFASFHDSGLTDCLLFSYGVVTALYNVIWSYIGYSNANYALSETRNPVRTLKIAAPTALIGVAIIYMFVNVSVVDHSFAYSMLKIDLNRSHTLPPYLRTKSSHPVEFWPRPSSVTCLVLVLNEPSPYSLRYLLSEMS